MLSKSIPNDCSEEYIFPCLKVAQQPSAVDSALPAIYSRRVLIFSTNDNHGISEAVQALCRAMEKLVERYSVLANSASCASGAWRFSPGQARLIIKELPLTFEELENANFSSKLLKHDELSSVVEMVDFENDWDCCKIQANFIEGGLLLCISILHIAMDGAAITRVIQDMARYTCDNRGPVVKMSPATLDRSRLSRSSSIPDITKMPAFLILNEAFDFTSRVKGSISSTMYRLKNESVNQLKSDCSKGLPPDCPFISSHDAVCALLFRQKIKARVKAGIITPTDRVQYSFPVECRRTIHPPLPSDFIGNAVIFTATPFLLVEDLLKPEGLSLAAAAIRQGIKDVDADFIDNAIAVMRSLKDPKTLNYYGAIHGKTTGIASTSYKGFVMPNDWHPAIGEYQLMRLLHGGFGDGMFVVMPVRDSGWEVIVTLDEVAMDVFEDEQWNKYTIKIEV
ncbi:hypothetical protein BCIN_07g07120 [Botrytis cinerea B05.10]|uniref:Uncharacterized protein n=2 Tax=Botryotinia fuckeliana TaxID=40559 RepID=A0A384JPE8_BOTFB|nr:hypothetical protein BCIN_07g07120 [Botrytis cinerea B05.10]XP_024550072.1 hypothetical protein BCIN_07g07120 [Botrytis cinerea B05.10]ATZ52224.1 hypothetical protein BCIN_07g07120 [Botrytis cinerea B05.10]ATZ52225.1 hypothetical protein BCIN_07g07120 [Botrytis cinerea B05.10]